MSMRTTNSNNWRARLILVGFLCVRGLSAEKSAFADEPTAQADQQASNTNAAQDTLGFGRHRTEQEAPFVKVFDLREFDTGISNPRSLSFIPKVGKFELKVTKGWAGILPLEDEAWKLSDCIRVYSQGSSQPVRIGEILFSGHEAVLEYSREEQNHDPTSFTVLASRTGTALMRFIRVAEGSISPVKCELRIVVEADTSEIEQAIKDAVPRAKIQISELRSESVVLRGSVPNREGISVIMEIARTFYVNVINQLEVTPATDESRQRRRDNPQQKENATPQDQVGEALQPRLKQQPTPSIAMPETTAPGNLGGARETEQDDLKRIRDEVRLLRDEVRRLADIIEKRQAAVPMNLPVQNVANEISPRPDAQSPTPTPSFDADNTVLFFTATWCGPCQKMAPIVTKLQRKGHPIRNVDIDREAALTRKHKVDSIPCFILIKDGEEIDRVIGATDEKTLSALTTSNYPPRNHKGFKADGTELVVVTYAVADLVLPIDHSEGNQKFRIAGNWLKLVEDITAMVQPDESNLKGQIWTIRPYEATHALVIRAPQAVHERIANLLSEKRASQNCQIAIETWLPMNVADDALKNAEVNTEFDLETGIGQITTRAVDRLLHSLGDGVQMAPKVTIFNEQFTHVGCQFQGIDGTPRDFQMDIRGVRIDEGRRIRLNVAVNHHNLVSESLSHSYTIADGDYLLIDVTKQVQRQKPEVPINGRMLIIVRATNCQVEEEMKILKR